MRDPRTEETPEIVLVARMGGFGRPTACPICLPVYCYLRLAKVFSLRHDRANPNSGTSIFLRFFLSSVVLWSFSMGMSLLSVFLDAVSCMSIFAICFQDWFLRFLFVIFLLFVSPIWLRVVYWVDPLGFGIITRWPSIFAIFLWHRINFGHA